MMVVICLKLCQGKNKYFFWYHYCYNHSIGFALHNSCQRCYYY